MVMAKKDRLHEESGRRRIDIDNARCSASWTSKRNSDKLASSLAPIHRSVAGRVATQRNIHAMELGGDCYAGKLAYRMRRGSRADILGCDHRMQEARRLCTGKTLESVN
jgi:hypothetical protein